MRRICRAAVTLLAMSCLVGASGCGATPQPVVLIKIPEKWVDEIITRIVEWVEDGTGIDIEKGDVKVQSLGAKQATTGEAHIGDFKITVNYRRAEFTSTPKDIPCSTDGIPTEEGNQRIKDAVEEIKSRIRAMR